MPELNRRGFLSRMGFVSGAVIGMPTVAAPFGDIVARTDRFKFRGWQVQWHGWNTPSNQWVKFGYWASWRAGDDAVTYVTTMGSHGRARDFDLLDLRHHTDWPTLSPASPEAICDDVKARACEVLLERLRYDAE